MNSKYELPSINKDGGWRERYEKELEASLLPKYLLLSELNQENTGSAAAILVSNTDGTGNYSASDNSRLRTASLGVQKQVESLDVFAEILPDATSQDLRRVIQSPRYAHIYLIGHSTRHSWLASDRSVNWYDTGKMVGNHLKNGIFANLGCGHIRSWNFIPLGRYVVSPNGILLGKNKIESTIHDMFDLDNYDVLG